MLTLEALTSLVIDDPDEGFRFRRLVEIVHSSESISLQVIPALFALFALCFRLFSLFALFALFFRLITLLLNQHSHTNCFI